MPSMNPRVTKVQRVSVKDQLSLLEHDFCGMSALETLEQITAASSSPEIQFDKTSAYLQLSSVVQANLPQLGKNRFSMHQFMRQYLQKKLPQVEGFSQDLVQLEMEQFESNYIEADEGHNLMQFFRTVVLYGSLKEEEIKQIARLFEKEKMRVNVKHAVFTLYYANLSGRIELFSSMLDVLNDLCVFVDFTLLSTITLLTDTVQHEEMRNSLLKTIESITALILLKQNDVSQTLTLERCDALIEFLVKEKLMTPEFEKLCQQVRQELVKKQSSAPLHSLTRFLTKDQEEQFSAVLEKHRVLGAAETVRMLEAEMIEDSDRVQQSPTEESKEQSYQKPISRQQSSSDSQHRRPSNDRDGNNSRGASNTRTTSATSQSGYMRIPSLLPRRNEDNEPSNKLLSELLSRSKKKNDQ